MVKFAAGLCRGYQHKTRKRRTLNTVGGAVFERGLAAALALGDKGRGAAAVAADNIHTAEAYHHGGDLIHAHARRNGSLTAVVYHHDQRTVSLYADAGAGSTAADCMILIGEATDAVLDDIAPAGDGLPFGAVKGLISRTNGDIALAVKHEIVAAIACILIIYLAVNDQHTQRMVISP